VAGGSAAAAGLPPLAVLAATVAGMTLPYAEIVAHRVFDEFKGDARTRANEMIASADRELGGDDPDQLADMTRKSPQTRLLTTMAVDAAARTTWPRKVIALGRVLAVGLIAEDEAKIDEQQLALSAMAEMDRPHVSLLHFLVTGPQALPLARPEAMAGAPLDVSGRRWTAHQITTNRPQLRPVLLGLMGTLIRHGLAVENNEATTALERPFAASSEAASSEQRARQIRAGSRLTAAAPAAHPAGPEDCADRSPTELGGTVARLYRLAADLAGRRPPPLDLPGG
jgi:hypothetical protein